MDMIQAANRLHHLSMRYAGAILELASGEKIGFIAQGTPGLHETRDLIDLLLFTRAEINGLIKIMIEATLITRERLTEIMTEEYDYVATTKAKHLGVEVTEDGLVFKKP